MTIPLKAAETEDQRIAQVIAEETDAFLAADFDRWAACWVHAPRTRDIYQSLTSGVFHLSGWDEVGSHMHGVIASGQVCKLTEFLRRDMEIHIYGSVAWVVFSAFQRDENGAEGESLETRILELGNDGWRIVYASYAQLRQFEARPGEIAVDAGGRCVWIGSGTKEKLRDHPTLTLSAGRLRARRREWDRRLRAGLKRAAELHGYFQQQQYAFDHGESFRLPLILGEYPDGRAVVCTLEIRSGYTVLNVDPEADTDRRVAIAAATFGLSAGQRALAERIARGESLAQAARALSISVNTARTHLGRIYAKTGVNAQTALVRILLGT